MADQQPHAADRQVPIWALRLALAAADTDARDGTLREVVESDCCWPCLVQALLDILASVSDPLVLAEIQQNLLDLLDG